MALDTLRKGAGRLFGMILMGLLVVSFGIWGIADIFRGYGTQTFIKVGNIDITPQDYERAQREALRAMSQEEGRNVTIQEARSQGLESRVLERLVGGAAVDMHAKALNLGVSQEALKEEVMKDPSLQDPTGNFNRPAFQQLLENMGLTEQGFLDEERRRSLRRQLLGTVGRPIVIPQVLVDALNTYNGETRTVRYVIVPQSAAPAVAAPSNDDLKRYYDNHHAKFTQPEYRKIGFVSLTPESVKDQVKITDDDLKAAFDAEKSKLGTPERRHIEQIAFPDKAAAAAAYQKIQGGASFEDIAKAQKQSEADIDLGEVTRDGMADSTIADAAFKLEANKVSEPVTGKLGTNVLLRVSQIEPGKMPSFDEAKPVLANKILHDRAQGVILDMHDKIEDARASGAKLSEVAAKFKLPYQTIEQVDRAGKAPDASLPPLPDKGDLLDGIFSSQPGVENDPIDAKGDGFVWYDVLGVTPQQLKPLDKVKDEVAANWREDQSEDRLQKYTRDLISSLQSGKSLEDLAKDLKTDIQTSEPLKRSSAVINILPNAVAQIFTLPQGGFGSAPNGVDGQRVLFKVDKVAPPPPVDVVSTAQLQQQLGQFVADDLIAEYLSGLENRYQVNVNQQALAKFAGGESEEQ